MMITALLTSLMMLASAAPATWLTTKTDQNRDFTQRDEFNQTYELPAGARVEVSSIRGPVEITTSNTATAEVQIIRSARTRSDLEYHKIEVKQTGNSLVVRGVQEPEERRRDNIQVDHHVILKLPRSVDVSVNSISGWVKVGDVDGQTYLNSISGSVNIGNVSGKLKLNSISGNVEVGNLGGEARVTSVSGNVSIDQVNGLLNVSSVSGNVNTTVVSLTPQGIHINSVTGSIEIGFKTEVNADFNAVGISGQVYFDLPNVTRDSESQSPPNVRARIGAGGTPITITSVTGSIRLTRS